MKDEINDYINYVYIEKKLSNNTKDAYLNDLIFFDTYVNHKPINEVNKNDITSFINHLYDIKDSSKTIARKLVSIRTFFDYLMMMKKIEVNPCETISSPKLQKKLPVTLNEEEIEKLLNFKPNTALEYRNKAMIELMYACGLRVSEMVNLEINDINLTDNYVRIFGKGKKEKGRASCTKYEMFSFVIRRVLSRITEIFRRSTKRSSRVGGTAKANRWDT